MKACVDCKWFKASQPIHIGYANPGADHPECSNPKASSRDVIYGKALCANERSGLAGAGGCGKNGKHWEEKNAA